MKLSSNLLHSSVPPLIAFHITKADGLIILAGKSGLPRLLNSFAQAVRNLRIEINAPGRSDLRHPLLVADRQAARAQVSQSARRHKILQRGG